MCATHVPFPNQYSVMADEIKVKRMWGGLTGKRESFKEFIVTVAGGHRVDEGKQTQTRPKRTQAVHVFHAPHLSVARWMAAFCVL